MKPTGRRMTVDYYNPTDPTPEVGDLIREESHDRRLKGYSRVLSVRKVKVRKSRGEIARYALRVQRTERPDEELVRHTITDYPPKPKKRAPPIGSVRCSIRCNMLDLAHPRPVGSATLPKCPHSI